jgi:hypothetical protein
MAKKKEKDEAVETEDVTPSEPEDKPKREPFDVLADVGRLYSEPLTGKIEMAQSLAQAVRNIHSNDPVRFKSAMKPAVVEDLASLVSALGHAVTAATDLADEVGDMLAQLRNVRPVPPKKKD